MITVNSYFCGAGLMDVGLLSAGLTIGQAFELDADACETYRRNLGDHVTRCDISGELVLEQDSCDGMVFTYPCTKKFRKAEAADFIEFLYATGSEFDVRWSEKALAIYDETMRAKAA